MGWILVNTEQDGQAVDMVEKAAEKFDTYHTLVWINDKNKKLTHENFHFYKWNGEQFEREKSVLVINPEDVPEPMTPEEFDEVYTLDDIKE